MNPMIRPLPPFLPRAAGLALGLLLTASAALAEPQIGGVAQRDYNGATGKRISVQAEEIRFRDDVFAGETVSTPLGGSTALRFQDDTMIQVGSSSTILLDKFVYDPGSGTGDAAINFSKGIFRFVTGDIRNKDAVRLTTPTTAITIRGTILRIFVASDGTSTVAVDEGAVDLKPCGGEPFHAVAGNTVRVSSACTGVAPVPASAMPSDPAVGDGGAQPPGDQGPDTAPRPERSKRSNDG
jgi:hypothetical protein